MLPGGGLRTLGVGADLYDEIDALVARAERMRAVLRVALYPYHWLTAGLDGDIQVIVEGTVESDSMVVTDAMDDVIFISSGTLRSEGHFRNIERTRRRGIEANADFPIRSATVFAAYSFQSATFGTALPIASRGA